MKDDKYWARRRKNNMAAKRSRDARRVKENQIAMRAAFLEKEVVSALFQLKLFFISTWYFWHSFAKIIFFAPFSSVFRYLCTFLFFPSFCAERCFEGRAGQGDQTVRRRTQASGTVWKTWWEEMLDGENRMTPLLFPYPLHLIQQHQQARRRRRRRRCYFFPKRWPSPFFPLCPVIQPCLLQKVQWKPCFLKW